MRRRRVIWTGLLACLLVPLVLYVTLPVAAPVVLRYLLQYWGYHHVTLQLGYPGWHTLQVPVLSLQKDLDGETLEVTVHDSQIEYDIGDLVSGRVRRLAIAHASVSWRGRSGNAAQPCTPPPTATSRPGLWASMSLGHPAHPMPELPWRALAVEQLHVFRECATGPLRELFISGTVQQAGESAEGSVVLRGPETAAYQLRFTTPQRGSLEATLQAEPAAPHPIMMVQSHVSQSPSGLQLAGRVETDLAQLAPFLAWLVPTSTDLQHVTGALQATWTGTAPATASLDTAWHDPAAGVTGTVELTLMLPKLAGIGDNLSVRLQGEVTGNAEQLAWTLHKDSRLAVDLKRATVPLPHTLRWLLPPKDQPVVIECPESIKGHLRWADTPLQFTLEGPIRAQYGAAQAPVQIEVNVLRAAGQDVEHLTAEGTYRLRGSAAQVPPDVLAVQEAQWNLHGTLALDHMRLRGTVAASSGVHLRDVRQADAVIPTATVQLTDDLPLRVNLRALQWAAGPAHFTVQTPQVVWQDTTVRIDQASLALHKLQGDHAHWQTEGALRLTGVSPQLSEVPMPATHWDTSFAVDDAALRLEAKGTAFGEAVTLRSRLEYLFATQAGAAELHLGPVQFDPAHVSWQTVLAPGSYPVDVTGGRLSGLVSLTWSPDARPLDHASVLYTGSATLTLEDLSGQYKNVRVNGLTTTLTLHTAEAEAIIMPEPARVTMAALQAGVDVTDLSLHLQLGWQPPATLPWVELRDVSAALFGARLTSAGLRFDSARPEPAFTVNVEHLDLQQLLQVEQHKGLEGTGVLDGVIPVRLTSAGVKVQDGRLEARPPGGVIRYQPASDTAQAAAAWDAQVYGVLQALSNFHYNVLTIGVQYVEDGTLHLTAKAAGQNPDWQQGRPIDFNLTVQENIPALLQSLQIVQGIEQSIEQRLQRR